MVLSSSGNPGEAPYMPFEDLQAERYVLDQLASRGIGETNTRQFQRFDLPKVVKNGSSDEPIQVEAGIVGGQYRGEVTERKGVPPAILPEMRDGSSSPPALS